MKRLAAAAVMVVLATAPAYAQGMKLTPAGQHHPNADESKDKDKPKVNDKDYKSALERIPPQGETVDPWQNVREKPKAK